MKKNEKFCVQIKKYDIITSVPISKKRLKERGYNQSTIIAKSLAKDLGLQYTDNLLFKKMDNIPQSLLKKENREDNVKNVYSFNTKRKEKVKNEKILIVDDIFTTGSTANECARILKNEKVEKIGILTIAKD